MSYILRHWLTVTLLLSVAPMSRVYAQAVSTASNALDRINFGDTTSDATSESKHAFENLGNPTGTGALGLTYRAIAPSAIMADIGNPSDNKVLTFTMTCDPTLQNYLTIQVWGSDTTLDVIYLYTASQGYEISNYYSTNEPEIDFQESDPILPGRFVYETIPIPISMTTGQSSVTLTLNAAQSYGYYSSGTTNLAAGQTSRPIYAAYTHTQPYLILNASDPQGAAPAAASPVVPSYNSSYLSSLVATMNTDIGDVLSNQVFGNSWSAAVSAGTVPPQIYGYFDAGKSANNHYTTAEWLNNAAVDTSNANNVSMERLDELAFAYTTPSFLTNYYQNSTVEQAVVAALDSYSYMQSLNGCWGDMTAWDGVGAGTTSLSNPYGRTNAQCSPIEGAGTWALGSSIVLMQNDPSFLASLNQPISTTLEPSVPRYRAYQTMLVEHMNFLNSSIGPGHAPNQDLLQARAYIYANLALQVLDKIYGTTYALSNAAMLPYVDVAAGLDNDQYGGVWISPGGLGLEVNGTGNGSYDGGYGLNDMNDLVTIATILADDGIETSANHPIRNVAMNAVHAFSNFIYPSLAMDGAAYATTIREEEDITFRKNLNIGEIASGSNYYAATQFSDPYALHAFYLEIANGIQWSLPGFNAGGFDDTLDSYMREYTDYATLINTVNSEPDPSGVSFLNEPSHLDAVWSDPISSTIAIKHNGEKLDMVLNWRPLQIPGQDNKPSAANEIVNNMARVHDTTATMDRIATIMMPSSGLTGASGAYKSGSYGTLYVGRYGNYLVGLNWQSTATTLTLPPDMTSGTATDLVSGTDYDLTSTPGVPVPASGSVALYQSLPTATLSALALAFSSDAITGSPATQTLTLNNSGTGPLLISAIGINGANTTDFSYTTTCGSTLGANSSCTLTVTFKPSAVGVRSATLNITSCVSAAAQAVSLTGTGTQPTAAVSVVATPSALNFGSATTLTATVTGDGAGPTGSIIFYDGTTSLGSRSLVGDVASYSATGLGVRTHSITAAYSGDTTYASVTSPAITVTVDAGTQLSLAPSPTSLSLAAGGSSTAQLTLTPQNSFTGTVSLICTSPQTFITCVLPSTATVGSSAANIAVSVSVASSIVRSDEPLRPFSSAHRVWLGFLPTGLLLLLPARKRRGRAIWYASGSIVLLLILQPIVACGGNAPNTSSNAGPVLPPAGAYLLTLTASGGGLAQSYSTTISVTVTN